MGWMGKKYIKFIFWHQKYIQKDEMKEGGWKSLSNSRVCCCQQMKFSCFAWINIIILFFLNCTYFLTINPIKSLNHFSENENKNAWY